MNHNSVSVISASTLFLVMFTSVIPLGHAVEWSPDMRLTWDTNVDTFPSIAQTSDGRIWVVWVSYRTGNAEIFYKIYNESLVHPWSSDKRLTNDSAFDLTPSIMQAQNGTIWVVWASKRTGDFEIYYKTYNGSWSSEKPLTTNPGKDDWDPAVMQAENGTIWVVWVTDDDLIYRVHNGTSWSSEKPLVTDEDSFDWHPSITQLIDGTIMVVWDSDRNLHDEDIYYKVYDGTWSPDTQLTTSMSDDSTPSILQAMNGTVWIAWNSIRLENMDIYYRTDSVPDVHDVAIFSVAPSKAIAYQGETVSIEVVAQNQGTEGNENVTVYCYANSTLIGSIARHVTSGQLWVSSEETPPLFQWDTSSFTPGVYTIWAEASVIPGENKTADNTYADGTVTVASLSDISVVSVVPSEGQAYPTWEVPLNVTVTVKNNGTTTPTFNVTAYNNATRIGTQTVTNLAPGVTRNLTFSWNLSDVAYGVYTISAEAVLLGEANPGDNVFTDGTVRVKMPGDVDGDRKVGYKDLFLAADAYGSKPGDHDWNPNCDLDHDNKVGWEDLFMLVDYYGEKY